MGGFGGVLGGEGLGGFWSVRFGSCGWGGVVGVCFCERSREVGR